MAVQLSSYPYRTNLRIPPVFAPDKELNTQRFKRREAGVRGSELHAVTGLWGGARRFGLQLTSKYTAANTELTSATVAPQ